MLELVLQRDEIELNDTLTSSLKNLRSLIIIGGLYEFRIWQFRRREAHTHTQADMPQAEIPVCLTARLRPCHETSPQKKVSN